MEGLISQVSILVVTLAVVFALPGYVNINEVPCIWNPDKPFSDFVKCLESTNSRQKRDYEDPRYDPYGPHANPCHTYVRINQPERRVGNKIDRLTDSALCDRALYRRWYRFDSAAGGLMPDECVQEFDCGTHAPIWLNGLHPQTYGQVADVEACVSLAGHCCNRRWYVRIANCGDFYTYLLNDTPGCYMAYCIGSEMPCPEGQSSPTGFTPGCSDNFPEMRGTLDLSVATEGSEVVFYCDYHGPIPAHSVLEVLWFVDGDMSGEGDAGEYPIWQETLLERRRSTLTEGRWIGKMGSSIFCKIRSKFRDGSGVPSPTVQSEKYFAGIKILQRSVNVSESDEETTMYVQSTVPVTCLPQFRETCRVSVQVAHDSNYQAKRCVDGKVRQVVFGECAVDITPDNWQNPQPVRVKAVRDFYHDGNKRMLIDFKPTYSTMLSHIWQNYQLPQVEVIAKDVPTKMCGSTGDPHYTTFDGLYYHVYLEGEFVLYKNTRLPIQINTRLEKCGGSVSCNCGVAVKAADDVIVIDRCNRRRRNMAFGESFPEGWRSLHRHALEQGGEFVKGLTIFEYDDGKRYTVHIPTGGYIDFQVGEHWINIYLYASSDDWYSTLGLCGTFDGDPTNDFTFRDRVTRTTAVDQSACGQDTDTCKFAEEWRVSERDTFFGPVVEVELEDHEFSSDQQYCKCEKDGHQTNVVCNYHYDVDNCQAKVQQKQGHDKTDDLVTIGRQRSRTVTIQGSSESSRSSSRLRRSADLHDEDDDYFSTEFVYDADFKGEEPSWPTPSGITEEDARTYCERFLLNTRMGITCKDIIKPQLNNLLMDCITDIKVTDDMTWAESAITTLSSECTEAIHADATLWGVDPDDMGAPPAPDRRQTTTVPPTEETATAEPEVKEPERQTSAGDLLLSLICPSDCTKHGTCVEGHCQCNNGYHGDDCSLLNIAMPTAYHLSTGGLCDIQKKACHKIRVYGTNFRNSNGLLCNFQPMNLTFNGPVMHGDIISTKAKFDTFEEVICQVPDNAVTDESSTSSGATYQAYSVSVANDLLHKTKPLNLIVFDSTCVTCSNSGSKSYCQDKEDSCQVGGHCYKSGDHDPDNCCKTCQPSKNRHTFFTNTENKMPEFIPWRTTYEVESGNPWQLDVDVSDPEHCDVTLNVRGRRPRGLTVSARGQGGVHLALSTSRPGHYQVTLAASDTCGATSSRIYHVMVTRGKQ